MSFRGNSFSFIYSPLGLEISPKYFVVITFCGSATQVAMATLPHSYFLYLLLANFLYLLLANLPHSDFLYLLLAALSHSYLLYLLLAALPHSQCGSAVPNRLLFLLLYAAMPPLVA